MHHYFFFHRSSSFFAVWLKYFFAVGDVVVVVRGATSVCAYRKYNLNSCGYWIGHTNTYYVHIECAILTTASFETHRCRNDQRTFFCCAVSSRLATLNACVQTTISFFPPLPSEKSFVEKMVFCIVNRTAEASSLSTEIVFIKYILLWL